MPIFLLILNISHLQKDLTFIFAGYFLVYVADRGWGALFQFVMLIL